MRSCVAILLVCTVVSLARADAVGESDPAYRDAVQQALVAYDQGDLPKAHAQFEAANARYPNARALRGLGTVELEQRDYVAAAMHLEQALASGELPLAGPLRQETEAALSEANSHVGRVIVLPSPADAQVELDAQPVQSGTPLVLAPGVYTLTLEASGFRSESRQLMVTANQSQLVHWSLQLLAVEAPPAPVAPAPPPPPPTPRESWKPWAVIGAGGAVAATGLALLAVGIRDYRQLADASSYADWQDKRDRYPKLVGIGGALLGAGGLSIAGGWWWRSHARRDVRVGLGTDRILLHGQF